MPKAKVIAFINYKGGVAKTTTTYHVGCSLAHHHGKRVLMVDIDPQTNLTFLSASIEDWEKFKKTRGTIASMYKRYLEGNAPDQALYLAGAGGCLHQEAHPWLGPNPLRC